MTAGTDLMEGSRRRGQGPIPVSQWLALSAPVNPIQLRASQGLQAALRTAAWRGVAPYPFVRHLTSGSLRMFVQVLHEVERPDVAEALAEFLGCPSHVSPWDRLDGDQQLLAAWTRLRASVDLAA